MNAAHWLGSATSSGSPLLPSQCLWSSTHPLAAPTRHIAGQENTSSVTAGTADE